MANRAESRGARTFPDDLRARSDEQLAALLLARPDLARPPASDSGTLASRASTPASVMRALDGLDSRLLHVLQALVVAEGDPAEATELCGVPLPELQGSADDLWAIALVWRSGAGYRTSGTVTQALGPHIAGLAEKDRSAPTPRVIRSSLEGISPEARRLLDSLSWGPPVGSLPPDAPAALDQAVNSLVNRGLLVRLSATRVLLRREVALVLRGGRIAPGEPLRPPAVEPVPVTERATASALAAVNDLVERIDELGHMLGAEPPRMLKSHALGVRELGRIAKTLDLDRENTILLLEFAYAAGLVGTAETGGRDSDDIVYAPTVAFGAWRYAEPATRWAHLALAWFGTDRAPGLIGETPPSGGTKGTAPPPAVFGCTASSAALRAVRHRTLAALDELRQGETPGAVAITDLTALVAWRRPRWDATLVANGVRMTVREAAALGIVTQQPETALTSAGAALWRAWHEHPAELGRLQTEDLADLPEAAEALSELATLGEHLPPAAHELLLQADLTAVVPGRVEGALADLLRSAAQLESRGGAAVFRFTADSVRRHLDTGATADDLLATLARLAPTGVPQPLDYLVRDVARRHGRLRVGSLTTFIVSDDVSALDAVEHDATVAGLGLRRLAPTVLAATAAKRAVVTALRTAGHAPVAEGVAGGVELEPPTATRASGRGRLGHSWTVAPRVPSQLTPDDATRIVTALRTGDAHALPDAGGRAGSGPRVRATDPTVTLDVLREAVASSSALWIGVASADGSTSRLLFRPTSVEAGRAHGTVEGFDEPRTFSVHRLIGAIPAG